MHFIPLIPALPVIFWYRIWKSSYDRAPILSCSRAQLHYCISLQVLGILESVLHLQST